MILASKKVIGESDTWTLSWDYLITHTLSMVKSFMFQKNIKFELYPEQRTHADVI